MKTPPRIRRLRAALAAVALAGVITAALAVSTAFGATRREARLPSLDRQVLGAINAFRTRHHLVPLRLTRGLDQSAGEHSVQMGRLGYFAHSSANGTSFWQRIQYFYRSRNYSYWSVGENLLWAAPSVSAARAMRMWIASPEHRQNLLTAKWREIGISAVHVSNAPGIFHGDSVTIITTDFGVRH
jgi:uncharacterized protein YkwD